MHPSTQRIIQVWFNRIKCDYSSIKFCCFFDLMGIINDKRILKRCQYRFFFFFEKNNQKMLLKILDDAKWSDERTLKFLSYRIYRLNLIASILNSSSFQWIDQCVDRCVDPI